MNKQTARLLEQHFDTAFTAPDGIAKLRELILTLAMQGRLVEQDPSDPPASELLKEIQAEKQRLVKAGKIKKPKPLPSIKPEDVPYELPKGWEWVRLGEVTDYNCRKKVSGDEITPDTWLLDLKDIEKGTSRILYRATFSERQSQSTKSTFHPGDVLYGKLRPYLDKVIVADREGVCSTEIVPIAPLQNIDAEFLRWLLKRPAFLVHVNSLMYGVKMPRLGTDDAVMSIHPIPPLPEQHRIVARIDQLMVRCNELETLRKEREKKRLAIHAAAIKKLLDTPDGSAWNFIQQHFGELYTVKENVAELRKAILQLAVMGRLIPPNPDDPPASELVKEIKAEKQRLVEAGKIKKSKPLPPIKPDEVPYELPKGWEWVRLNDTLDVRDGTHDTPKYIPVGYPLVTSKNIYKGTLSLDDVKYISKKDHKKIAKRSRVDRGDILFAMIGSIGNPVIVDCDLEFSIKNVALFKSFLDGKPSNRYLQYYLVLAQENMKAISSGAVQSFVSLNFLRCYPFPLPPLPEQHRIISRIDQIMALCDTLEQQIDAATSKQTETLNAVMAGVDG
jgi:type I restriction enzyme, S subunit